MSQEKRSTEKARVVVGMSGGVDSSVAALLLREQGYDVIGVTMRIWQCGQEDERSTACCSLSAVNDARRVAEQLGIPFYVMDFREGFNEKVISYFTSEYMRGRTPNPCIACNRYIKFGDFLHKARGLGATYIATGHYVKIEYDEARRRYLLLRGNDKRKDQSYVLYAMTQEQLAHTLFPLGGFTKDLVRKKARELGLETAEKAESQEICFITNNDYKSFISARAKDKEIMPGPFLNTQRKVIGQHQGLPYYTVGQRKGLGLALGYPVFVAALEPDTNSVIVGKDAENYRSVLLADENNFIAINKLEEPIEVEAKIRYGANPAPALISPMPDGQVEVRFISPQRAITPGQSVVYYKNDVVIGGGIIDKVIA